MVEPLLQQPAHEPGWTPPLLVSDNANGECHRQALACVTGWHPFHLGWSCPHDRAYTYEEWKDHWVRLLRDRGFTTTTLWGDSVVRGWLDAGHMDDRYWVAVVQGMAGGGNNSSGHHAIVMHGRRFHFDCNQGGGNARKQAPHRYHGAWILEPR